MLRGGIYHSPPNYHCAPVPVLHAHGRVWRSVEDDAAQDHYRDFLAGVISAPEDADTIPNGPRQLHQSGLSMSTIPLLLNTWPLSL